METLPTEHISVKNFQIKKLMDDVNEIQGKLSLTSVNRLSVIRRIDTILTSLALETNNINSTLGHSIALRRINRNFQELVMQAKHNLRDVAFYSALGNYYKVEEGVHKLQLKLNVLTKLIAEIQNQQLLLK